MHVCSPRGAPQGNVAVDIARVLLKPAEDLAKTDMAVRWGRKIPPPHSAPYPHPLRHSSYRTAVEREGMPLVRSLIPINSSTCPPAPLQEHAVQQLRQSAVKRVSVIGRRGPAQAQFTPKELRELLSLPGVRVVRRCPPRAAVREI